MDETAAPEVPEARTGQDMPLVDEAVRAGNCQVGREFVVVDAEPIVAAEKLVVVAPRWC